MGKHDGKFQLNKHGDLMPICGWCGKPFRDGNCGDFKNYPADGVVSVFFICEEPNCPSEGDETVFTYRPLVDRETLDYKEAS